MKIDDYQKQVFEKKKREFQKLFENDDAQKYLKPGSFAPGFIDVIKYVSRPLVTTTNGETREIKNFHFSTAGLLMQDPNDQLEHERLEQAEKLVKDLHVKKREFENKIKGIEEKEAERLRSEIEKVKEYEEKEEEERAQRKKIEKLDNIKRIQMRKEERAKNKAIWEEELKKYQQKEPLYVQIEKRYQEEVELPAIKRQQQVLEEIHEFHKPLDREELLQHEKSVLAKMEETKLKQQISALQHPKRRLDALLPKSKFEDYFSVRFSYERAKEAQKEVRKKMFEFAASIKKPSPKRKKEVELERITSNTSATSKHPRSSTIEERSRDEIQSEIFSSPAPSRGPGTLTSANPLRGRHRTVDGKNIGMNSASKEKDASNAEHAYPDYLVSIRKKYNLQVQKDKWKNILNQTELDLTTKRQQVLIEASRLEEQVGLKEMFLKANRRNKAAINRYLEESEEVDSILLNSIEAKLSLLSEEVNALDQSTMLPAIKKRGRMSNGYGQNSKVNKSMDAGVSRIKSFNVSPSGAG